MSAGRDITSPAELPARMRAKITEELCPVAGLDGFCWTWTGCVQSKGYGCWNYDGRRQEQIVAAIATQSTTAVVPVASPAGLVPRSRFRRRAEVPA